MQITPLRVYEFELLLSDEATDVQAEAAYAFFGEGGDAPASVLSVVLGYRSGTSYAGCDVEADSLEEAVAVVVPGLRGVGLTVTGLHVKASELPAMA